MLAFTEMVPQLLSLPGRGFLLSERFNQDRLETYFGKQRSRGRYCDNPSVQQFFSNSDILRVVNELSLDPFRSNVRGRKRRPLEIEDINAPLPKRSQRRTRQNSV